MFFNSILWFSSKHKNTESVGSMSNTNQLFVGYQQDYLHLLFDLSSLDTLLSYVIADL